MMMSSREGFDSSGMIADQADLPNKNLAGAWDAIKIPDEVRERLLAQSILALQLRQKFPFEAMPVHGLIVLSGPPGTGKTTLGRGLASKISDAIRGTQVRFIQIDPHALTSSSLGKSQKEVTKLFQQTIPEYADGGICIVLLDEVETLAPDRHRLSFEANPVDVHRATDAALAGIDLLTRKHRNVLLIATTNFPEAVDRALISRADWVEDIGLPNDEARLEIIEDVLNHLSTAWPRLKDLRTDLHGFVDASKGLDGRQLRKGIISAAAISVETARDLNVMKAEHVIETLTAIRKTQARPAKGGHS